MATQRKTTMKPIQQVDISADIETNETDKQTSTPDKFPPKGQYHQKAIAQEFGFDPSGIEKYYLPEALEIYQVCPQMLKAGHLFTQVFYDLMFLMRQHRMRERMVINSAGQIVRHAPKASGEKGKPVLEKNTNRMGKEEFRLWYWEQHEELIPPVADDSVQAASRENPAIAPEIVIDDYDESTNDDFDGTLTKVEDFGGTFGNFADIMVGQFKQQGRGLAAQCAEGFQQEFTEGMNDFFGAMNKAASSRNGRKKS